MSHYHIICHLSHVILLPYFYCLVSGVACQLSGVTCNSKTVRARENKFWEKDHLLPPVTCHVSHVTCHMSHVPLYLFFSLDKVVNLVGGGSVINRARLILTCAFSTLPSLGLEIISYRILLQKFHNSGPLNHSHLMVCCPSTWCQYVLAYA